jgi:hypothetical protein
MYAVATKQMAGALELPFLVRLASAFFVAALAAWTLALIGLGWELLRELVRPGVS